MLTIQEIKGFSDKELDLELSKAKKELVKLKLGVKMGQEKATHKVREMKKQVAMLKTVMSAFQKGVVKSKSKSKSKSVKA